MDSIRKRKMAIIFTIQFNFQNLLTIDKDSSIHNILVNEFKLETPTTDFLLSYVFLIIELLPIYSRKTEIGANRIE